MFGVQATYNPGGSGLASCLVQSDQRPDGHVGIVGLGVGDLGHREHKSGCPVREVQYHLQTIGVCLVGLRVLRQVVWQQSGHS